MQLVIGDKNYSTWSMRPWLLLTAFNVPFEEKMELLSPHDTLAARLLRYSPSVRVPVLLDGELTVWDTLAICEYISEHYLDGRGWPRDVRARAQARAVTAEMHASFSALRGALPMNLRARRRLPLSEAVRADIRRIDDIWTQYPRHHSNGGGWLFGDFSIADCFFAPVAMRFLTYVGVELSEAAWRYQQHISECDAVKKWRAEAATEDNIVAKDEAGEEL